MDEGRRRTDDYKAALERAKTAEREEDLLEEHDLMDITFEDAALQCWKAAKSYTARYGRREAKQVDFLFYFNKENDDVQYSGAPSVNSLAFRSLSVIAGNFCCVLYAHDGAPEFLRRRIAMDHGSS
jgi:hypothetical protein